MGPGVRKSNQPTRKLSRHLLSDGLRPPNTGASSVVGIVLAYRLGHFYDETYSPRPVLANETRFQITTKLPFH